MRIIIVNFLLCYVFYLFHETAMQSKFSLLLLTLSMLLTNYCIAQHNDCELQHTTLYYDSLQTTYGQNKIFDSKYLKPALLALKAYPELKGTSITFVEKPIKTLMAARPRPGFIFHSKKNRHYIIIISTNPKNNSKDVFSRMSICALTGILSHEYAHIFDYSTKSDLGMLWFAMKYYFDKRTIERNTDLEAVKRGFGDELIAFDRFIYKSKLPSKKYLRNKRKNYLSVNEIEHKIDGNL